MTEHGSKRLAERARHWANGDPDAQTRAQLLALVDREAWGELAGCLGPELDFGTAGLRGQVGPGPARMNIAVVTRATRALAEHLVATVPDARVLGVVIGYDARPTSRSFAEAAAAVLLGAGIRVRWFDAAAPTPLVAYAARVLGSAAAVVVTASHNPSADNGLKIYGPGAMQLIPPADGDVARRRDRLGPATEIPKAPVGVLAGALDAVPSSILDRYLSELDALAPARTGDRRLRIAYTPLHGVGLEAVSRALRLRGFSELCVVAEQAEPDGTFPTVPNPNPEHAGTLDRVLSLAARSGAELVLANDPDADRLAAAVPLPGGGFHVFSGNELATLLAQFALAEAGLRNGRKPLLVSSIVSTPLLVEIGRAHGARTERTLTGFKWIWACAHQLQSLTDARLALGCEEALGYSLGSLVRDKDGISAAVWLAELAARERLQGRTLLDLLHDLYRVHGAWSSAQVSLQTAAGAGGAALAQRLDRFAARPPQDLAGERCVDLVDYRENAEARPPWLGAQSLFELRLEGARVLVRPSGTEPKLKIYADAREAIGRGEAPGAAALRARDRAERLAKAARALLDPDQTSAS